VNFFLTAIKIMNITKYYLTIALSLVAFLSKAQERTDTVQANQLDEVVLTDGWGISHFSH
jgi:hypothetical protein